MKPAVAVEMKSRGRAPAAEAAERPRSEAKGEAGAPAGLPRFLQASAAPVVTQRQSAEAGLATSSDLDQRLAGTGGGAPLTAGVRGRLEGALGADLSDLRVHTDAEADDLTRTVGARAFTRGSDVYFRGGNLRPASAEGRRLLLHEVVHTLQQAAGPVDATPLAEGVAVSSPTDRFEREADRLADLADRPWGSEIGERIPRARFEARPGRASHAGIRHADGRAHLQRTLDDDFKGLQETVVTGPVPAGGRPPGQILVRNQSGLEVFAPYRIYSLQDIPPQYDQLRIRSGATEVLARHGEAFYETLKRIGRDPMVSIGNLRSFQTRARNQVSVMMALYDGQLHFVGFDMFQLEASFLTGDEPYMHAGYVESLEGSRGVGKSLFANRIVQVFASGGSQMQLEVGLSERTERFHQQLQETAGLPLQEMGSYTLNIRQMIQVLVSWADSLTSYQRGALIALVTGTAEPTVQDVMPILSNPHGPGGGSGGAPGGLPSGGQGEPSRPPGGPPAGSPPAGALAGVTAALKELQANVRVPAVVDSFAALRDPDVVREAIAGHQGLVQLGGSIYEVSVSGQGATSRLIEPQAITLSLPAPAGQAVASAGTMNLPSPLGQYPTAAPPILNLRPAGDIVVGGTVIPPSVTTAQAGDLILIHELGGEWLGGKAEWLVADPLTGQKVAGIFSGGKLYRLTTLNRWSLTVDPSGRVMRPDTIMVGGRRMQVTEVVPEEPTTAAGPRTGLGRFRGGPIGSAGAGLGLLAVASDMMRIVGATYQVQREINQMWEAQIDLWNSVGADPRVLVWDWERKEPMSPETEARTGVFLNSQRSRYVADIDVEAFKRRLPAIIEEYKDLELFLALGNAAGLGHGRAIRKEGDRYLATVNGVDYGRQKEYDITDTIEQVRALTIRRSDAQMEAELRGFPDSAIGNIFCLKSGRNTPLYRSAGGSWISGDQRLIDTNLFLGPNPWVRTLGRRYAKWASLLSGSSMVLVAPANGDALRAAQLATYRVGRQDIDEALEEVKNGGREVVSESRGPGGRLEGFVAGPDAAGRFGFTRYFRDREDPENWTAAVGELKQFWVDASELEPVGFEEVRGSSGPADLV
jgi:hypothetical protein